MQEKTFDVLAPFARWAQDRPEAPACIDARGTWRWGAFHAAVQETAHGLRALADAGAIAHDKPVVGVLGRNSAAFAIATCGVIGSGAAFELFPADQPAGVLHELVQRSGVTLLIVDEEFLPLQAGCVARLVTLDALREAGRLPGAAARAALQAEEGVFSIVYSSGTTGIPKAIVHSAAGRAAVNQAAAGMGIGTAAVNLVALPMFNNLSLVTWLPALVNGGCNVVLDAFDARAFCEAVARQRATHAILSPAQYRALLALGDLSGFDLSSLQLHLSSSSRLAAHEKAAIAQAMPGQFCEIYGVTEGGVGTLLNCRDAAKLHTVGTPMGMYDMKVIDDAGQPLPAGEVGRIVGHSAFMMTGYRDPRHQPVYWEAPEAPGRRYFVPGDLGHFDADGCLVVLDRAEDTRHLGDVHLFPSAIEADLLAHSTCRELAVTLSGRPPQLSALTVHWVGDAGEETALRRRLAQQHPNLPDVRLCRCERLPRNTMGKLLRRELA